MIGDLGTRMKNWMVLKFGGTSVARWDRWSVIARQAVRAAATHRVLLVASALAKVSDQLIRAIEAARTGEAGPVLAAIRAQHRALADEIGVASTDWAPVETLLQELESKLEGIRLTQEASPRLRAQILAFGELMSTRLGVAALARLGVHAAWLDAREVLVAENRPHEPEDRRFLEAQLPIESDPARIESRVGAAEVVLTQGFIARRPEGDTCLLGRGGSDTSAAHLAALLRADQLEIWTDVHGLFTADPRTVPTARMIRRLDYREAEELAAMGAKVLHPRSLPPVARSGVPLVIRNTLAPDEPGTEIGALPDDRPSVTAVTCRSGITLLSLSTLAMWETPGFLARTFRCFEEQGVSIDLVATSEAEVSVTIDSLPGGFDGQPFRSLLERLSALGEVRVAHPCSVISIVGRRIRTVLAEIGPALAVFGDRSVHLLTQSSEDLNLSFVVDEADAPALVEKLHATLFSAQGDDERFGPTWQLLEQRPLPADGRLAADPWWLTRREELLRIASDGRPRYVYNLPTVAERAASLRERLPSIGRFYYALKANANPRVMGTIWDAGLGFECVSWPEVMRVRRAFGLGTDVLFTPNFCPVEEYALAFEAGAEVTLDGPHLLKQAPEIFRGRRVALRIDPGFTRGHHAKVRTAGAHAKFGQGIDELDRWVEELSRNEVQVVGLHSHVGSGILEPETWARTAEVLAELAKRFPLLEWIDLGGGIGVPERAGQSAIDLGEVELALSRAGVRPPGIEWRMEPGRFLVAESGVLLAPVTQVRQKGGVGFVGLAAGMNALLRPALYGAYHGIHNLTRWGEPPTGYWHVVGPICESSDVLGRDRFLAEPQAGDLFLIENAGAYGAVMSSTYNLRELAAEAVLE